MSFIEILQLLIDNLAVPILIAIGGGLALIASKWIEKIGNSITLKNEIDSIGKRTKARKDILDSLAPMVESAVASNMQLADTMRKRNGKLTEEDAAELNRSAQELIMHTLPTSLTEDDGVLLEIIGGREQLEATINVMIEKYVYEYKLKSSTMTTNVSENSSDTNKKPVIYPGSRRFY